MGTHKCKKVSCGFYKLFRPQGTWRISETNQLNIRPKATAGKNNGQEDPRNKEEEATFPQIRSSSPDKEPEDTMCGLETLDDQQLRRVDGPRK